jgi:hypothetical protein
MYVLTGNVNPIAVTDGILFQLSANPGGLSPDEHISTFRGEAHGGGEITFIAEMHERDGSLLVFDA